MSSSSAEASAPKISVCLLSYNHGHVIAQAMEGVLAQTFGDFELIVSDDCSTDDSMKVIESFAARDPRVKPLRTPSNLGMAGNTNFAVSHARGEYIALLHHDDVPEPALLARWLGVADADGNITFVFNDYLMDDRWIGHHKETILRERMDGDDFLRKRLLKRWDSPIRGTALIRTSAFRSLGGMDERFGLLADIDLWMRLAQGAKVGYVGEPLIRVYRRYRAGYPQEYTDFTWTRLKLLFDIHAANIRRAYPQGSLGHRIASARFRIRVSREVLKWLAYGIVKGRRDILTGASERVSVHELPVVGSIGRIAARCALLAFKRGQTT